MLKKNRNAKVPEKDMSAASVLFSVAVMKNPDKSNLMDRGSILAQSSRVWLIMVGNSKQKESGAAGHIAFTKSRMITNCAQLSCSIQIPARE